MASYLKYLKLEDQENPIDDIILHFENLKRVSEFANIDNIYI